MKRIALVLLSSLCLTLPNLAQQKDDPACKDHPLFTRMPTYWIRGCDHKEFYAYDFKLAQGKTEHVEGEYWRLSYYPQAKATSKPSDLQILRNYENAIKQQGGTVLAAEKGRETFRLAKNGKEVWVEVSAEFTGKYGLIIVEKQAMAQDVVANADAMKAGLAESGHVEVPGILFDFGKAELKPESEGALKEVARMLQVSAGLKVWVVGHTDYVGSAESNLALSAARAASVVKYLAGNLGIDPKRLGSFGAGPYAPVAPNNTEEGRARNRRVELVAQP